MSFELQTGPYLLNQFNLCTSNLPSWLNDKTKAIYLPSLEENIQKFGKVNTGGWGEVLPFWTVRGRAAGQGMVFWPCCPKRGTQFDLPLS